MSKLSQLKQDAYQAAKDRDWTKAVTVYEQILEIDKKNPTAVNELGDICLKAGEIQRAVRSFLNAASMYRKNGLLNNAVAIYKKILRHDEKNLNAHWYLAETRASQGLKVEGEQHGLVFLENSEGVSGDLKEIFLKRCVTLFELFPESESILDKLVQIFRMWEMSLEAGRAQALLCCLLYDKGETEEAALAMEKVQGREPAVANYPEYAQWCRRLNPQAETSAGTFDSFGSVDLGGLRTETPAEPAPVPPAAIRPATVETSFADVAADVAADRPVPEPGLTDETSFANLGMDSEPGSEPDGDDPLAVEKDEDGCISIDTGDGPGLQEILAAAASCIPVDSGPPPADPAARERAPGQNGRPTPPDEQVDLLAQILAEDGGDLLGSDSDQLETITAEIGSMGGGDEMDDQPDRLYEMGMVYLEMGMHDQACASFAKASGDPGFAARAYEMWSMTLQKAKRDQEAMEVLNRGLQDGNLDQTGRLGLLYHLGKAHEQTGNKEEAVDCFDQITAVDPDYLDAGKRHDRLMATL